MKCSASARFPKKMAGKLPIRRTSAAWGTTANGLIPWGAGPSGPPGPPGPPGAPGPPGPLPGFLLNALLIAVVIRWVAVKVLPPVTAAAGVAAVPLVVAVVVAACTIMVGWVVVVLMTVRIVGVSLGQVPIGLFRIIEASKEVSLFNSSSVEWVSLVSLGLVESDS